MASGSRDTFGGALGRLPPLSSRDPARRNGASTANASDSSPESGESGDAWLPHDHGRVVLYVQPRSRAALEVEALGQHYAETLASLSDALAVDAAALPSIAVYVADAPEGDRPILSDAAEAASVGEAAGPAPALAIRTFLGADGPPTTVEAELARIVLEHDLGPATRASRFWDAGLAGYLAARTGRSASHAEATAHCRQQLEDGALPPLGDLVAQAADRTSALASTAATAFADYAIERYGLAQYRRLLRAVRTDAEDQFSTIFKTPLAVADRDWRRAIEASGRRRAPTLWTTLRRLAPMLRPYWPAGLVILGCALVGILFSLALPLSFRFLIDNVLGRRPLSVMIPFIGPAGHTIAPGDEQFDALVGLLGILGVLYVLNAAARVGLNVVLVSASESFGLTLRRTLAERLGRLPASYYARTSAVDVSQRVVQDTSAVQQVVVAAAVPLFTASLSTLAFAALLVVLEPKLAVVALCGLPVLAVISMMRRRGRRAAARERTRRLADLSAQVSESASAHLLSKLYGGGAYFAQRLVRRMQMHRQLNIAFGRENALLGQGNTLTLGLTQVAVLLAGGLLIVSSEGHDLAPGGLVAFYLVLSQMLGPIGQAAMASQNVAGASAGVERVAALLAEPVERDEPNATELTELRESIRLRNLSFAYPGGGEALSDVSLEIPAGATVAFVGPTGAGKSSILHLLPRLYEPTGGSIIWDGVDLRQASLASLRERVILVPQEPMLLSATVYENIRLGLDAVPDDVRRASRLACADEFIARLPLGYDTVIGERGVGLSGGQRQRIALARALLRRPSVLVLDEATSALDATTQRSVSDNLRAALPHCTVVKIAHRLETIVDADVIFVLDGGRLVEQGRHHELVARRGAYARLFEDQVGSLRAAADPDAREASRRLARIAPFSDFSSSDLDRLAATLDRREVAARAEIYRKGERANTLYVVASGTVALSSGGGRSPDGHGVDLLDAGAILGAQALIGGQPYGATATADADVVLYGLTRDEYTALFDDLPAEVDSGVPSDEASHDRPSDAGDETPRE